MAKFGKVNSADTDGYLPPAGQIVLTESVHDLYIYIYTHLDIAIHVHLFSDFLLVCVEIYASKLISSRTDLILNIL